MDLYEALKHGTSADELLKAFHKELDEASARIAAEEEAENVINEEYIANCRTELAESILNYAEAFLGTDTTESFTVDSIVDTLKDFEKEMESTVTLSKKLDKILKKAESKDKEPVGIKITTRTVDDKDKDIIDKFIKSLK